MNAQVLASLLCVGMAVAAWTLWALTWQPLQRLWVRLVVSGGLLVLTLQLAVAAVACDSDALAGTRATAAGAALFFVSLGVSVVWLALLALVVAHHDGAQRGGWAFLATAAAAVAVAHLGAGLPGP
jgi:hypothetical protein